jgi:glutaredoxin
VKVYNEMRCPFCKSLLYMEVTLDRMICPHCRKTVEIKDEGDWKEDPYLKTSDLA